MFTIRILAHQRGPNGVEICREEAVAFAKHLSVSADHASSASDEFVVALAVAGSFEACRRLLRELAAVGADRITVSLMSGGRERRLAELLDVWEGVAS